MISTEGQIGVHLFLNIFDSHHFYIGKWFGMQFMFFFYIFFAEKSYHLYILDLKSHRYIDLIY